MAWEMNENLFYRRFLENYFIDKNDFNTIIKECLTPGCINIDIELENKIINEAYDYIMFDEQKEDFYFESNLIYNHVINYWNNTLSLLKEEHRISTHNMTDQMLRPENLYKPRNPLESLGSLFLLENMEYIRMSDRMDFFEQKKHLNNEIGQTLFRGLFLEKINALDENLLGKGKKIVIHEHDWKNFIESLYPDTEFNRRNTPHSFDMAVLEGKNTSFYEIKNFYIPEKDINNTLDYFKKTKNLLEVIKKQIEFSKETNSNVYLFITNTSNFEKVIIPLKDLYRLLEKNDIKLSFKDLREYVKTNYEELYKKPLQQKDITLDTSDKDFFNSTIHLFQRNLNLNYLQIQTHCKNNLEFSNEIDELILDKIDSKEDLQILLANKNEHYIQKNDLKLFYDYFNNFFDDTDFTDKSMVSLRYKNFKNCINNILELKGRKKISLDNTAPYETYSRNKKFLEIFTKLKISENVIHSEKLFKKFLSNLADKIDINELKKNLPQGINGKDYIYRIEKFKTKVAPEKYI